MLRCIFIGQFDGFFHILHKNQLAIDQRLLCDLPTWQASQLVLYFVFHFFEHLLGCSDQYHLTIQPVFGLREEVGSYELRSSGFIGYDFYFRRTCRHVDSHIVHSHHLLGCHYILVSRTENLVYLRYTLGTVCHGSDGLHATRLEYLAYTCYLSRREDGRIHLAFLVRRGAEYDFLASGNLGRHGQHQYGREERSGSSRYIQTYLLNAHRLLPTSDTFHGFHLLAFELLLLVERIDVSLCQEDSYFQFDRHLGFGFLHFFRSYGQRLQLDMVELLCIFQYSLVAIRLHVL